MGFWGPAQKQEQKPKLRDSDPERKWGCTEELVTGSLLLDVPGSALHLPPTMGLGSNSPHLSSKDPCLAPGREPMAPPALPGITGRWAQRREAGHRALGLTTQDKVRNQPRAPGVPVRGSGILPAGSPGLWVPGLTRQPTWRQGLTRPFGSHAQVISRNRGDGSACGVCKEAEAPAGQENMFL